MKFFKSKKTIALLSVIIILLVLIIRHIYCVNSAFYEVEYEKNDISDLIRAEKLSDKDYEVIFKNTGVAPGAAKDIIKNKDYELLDKLNDMYFEQPQIVKVYIASPVTVEERVAKEKTPLVPLKKGDILITFNTHTLEWRHGHCGLVLTENNEKILEHTSIGNTSCINFASSWGKYPGFVVLRHKDPTVGEKAADYASKHLIDIEYSLFAGITDKDMSDNDKIDSHCAHIVWQAYKAAGKDIDKDGGIIVTPNDIATCKDLEVVQIYGIDPEDYSDRILR